MKTKIKSLAIGVLATTAFVVLSGTAQATPYYTNAVTGWGQDLCQSKCGTQLITTETYDGNPLHGGAFVINGQVNNNMEVRANLPIPVVLTNIGDTITVCAQFTWPTGNLGGGVWRMWMGDTNYQDGGTLADIETPSSSWYGNSTNWYGGVWTNAASRQNQTNWLGYIVNFGAGANSTTSLNGRAGGTSKDWDSTSGDSYGLLNPPTFTPPLPNAPANAVATASPFYVCMSVQLVAPNFVVVYYSETNQSSITNGPNSFVDLYTITNQGLFYDDGVIGENTGLGRKDQISSPKFTSIGWFQNATDGADGNNGSKALGPFVYSNIIVSYYNTGPFNCGYTNVDVEDFTTNQYGPTGAPIINTWTNWYGGAWYTNTFSSSDASNYPDSGSLEITANWTNLTTGTADQFFVYNKLGNMPTLHGLNYVEFMCDVQFDSSSPVTTNSTGKGIYGHLQFGMEDFHGVFQIFSNTASANQLVSGVEVPAGSNGWYHVNLPINAFNYGYFGQISNIVIKMDGNWYSTTYPLTNGTTTMRVDNISFLELTVNDGILVLNPPPAMYIEPALTSVRVFAKAPSKYTRNEFGTVSSGESFAVAPYPKGYVFTVTNMPPMSQSMQVDLWLIPVASLPSGIQNNGYWSDPSADFDATNAFGLVINNSQTGTNVNYGVWVGYHTNSPQTSLNPGSTGSGVVNLLTNYSTTVHNETTGDGTWSLIFSDANHGAVDGPGLTTKTFTIPSGAELKFNGAVVAYFGIQPNGAVGYTHVDYTSIVITNDVNGFTNDFTKPGLAYSGSTLGNLKIVANPPDPNAAPVVPSTTALWLDWVFPAAGFDVEENTNSDAGLIQPHTSWVYPASIQTPPYNVNLNTILMGGNRYWVQIPKVDLQAGQTNLFFRLSSPPYFP